MIAGILAALAVMLAGAPQAGERYEAGQVWEYRTRPQDAGSVVAIREVEDHAVLGRIYHVTATDIELGIGGQTTLAHAPVSTATLDASVTVLTEAPADLPDWRRGVRIWRADEGGVYDISLSEIAQVLDEQYALMGGRSH